jgi:hypothetical protein
VTRRLLAGPRTGVEPTQMPKPAVARNALASQGAFHGEGIHGRCGEGVGSRLYADGVENPQALQDTTYSKGVRRTSGNGNARGSHTASTGPYSRQQQQQ